MNWNFPDFNKEDYKGVDSIVFVCVLKTHDPRNSVYAQLYNATDKVEINNSTVESTSTNWKYVYSKNIMEDLPSKKINLTVRIRTETNPIAVDIGPVSYLYIYKNGK